MLTAWGQRAAGGWSPHWGAVREGSHHRARVGGAGGWAERLAGGEEPSCWRGEKAGAQGTPESFSSSEVGSGQCTRPHPLWAPINHKPLGRCLRRGRSPGVHRPELGRPVSPHTPPVLPHPSLGSHPTSRLRETWWPGEAHRHPRLVIPGGSPLLPPWGPTLPGGAPLLLFSAGNTEVGGSHQQSMTVRSQ